MDLPGGRSFEPAALRHASFLTAGATVVAGVLLLLAIVLVLFVLPYLLVAAT